MKQYCLITFILLCLYPMVQGSDVDNQNMLGAMSDMNTIGPDDTENWKKFNGYKDMIELYVKQKFVGNTINF